MHIDDILRLPSMPACSPSIRGAHTGSLTVSTWSSSMRVILRQFERLCRNRYSRRREIWCSMSSFACRTVPASGTIQRAGL